MVTATFDLSFIVFSYPLREVLENIEMIKCRQQVTLTIWSFVDWGEIFLLLLFIFFSLAEKYLFWIFGLNLSVKHEKINR